MDLSQLTAAGAVNQVCDVLRISTARQMQVALALVVCELYSGSVLAKVWIKQQDPLLQTKLRDVQEAITTEALEQVKTLPALGAMSTGMLSAETCGGNERAVCPSDAPGGLAVPDTVLVTGSMPSSPEAAKILGNARAMIKQELVGVVEPHLLARFQLFVLASLVAGLFAMVSLWIWARRDSEQDIVLQQDQALLE